MCDNSWSVLSCISLHDQHFIEQLKAFHLVWLKQTIPAHRWIVLTVNLAIYLENRACMNICLATVAGWSKFTWWTWLPRLFCRIALLWLSNNCLFHHGQTISSCLPAKKESCWGWISRLTVEWVASFHTMEKLGSGFKYSLCSPRKLGKISILTHFFSGWVETTNYRGYIMPQAWWTWLEANHPLAVIVSCMGMLAGNGVFLCQSCFESGKAGWCWIFDDIWMLATFNEIFPLCTMTHQRFLFCFPILKVSSWFDFCASTDLLPTRTLNLKLYSFP